jgi:uncharacterized protein YegL
MLGPYLKGVITMPGRLDEVEFEDNPEPRCAVVLLLDVSASMSGQPISELNQGLQDFEQTLKTDALASLRVEVAVVTFGSAVQAIDVRKGGFQPIPFDAQQAFVTADQFCAPTLATSGLTPMGEALRKSLQLLKERKNIYKQNGIDYFRPWMFLITDGGPNDEWESAATQVREEEDRKGVVLYAVGVEGADMQTLARFCDPNRQPLKLKGLAFRELFQWLSKSLSGVSQSRPGEQVPLPPPAGWAQLET